MHENVAVVLLVIDNLPPVLLSNLQVGAECMLDIGYGDAVALATSETLYKHLKAHGLRKHNVAHHWRGTSGLEMKQKGHRRVQCM